MLLQTMYGQDQFWRKLTEVCSFSEVPRVYCEQVSYALNGCVSKFASVLFPDELLPRDCIFAHYVVSMLLPSALQSQKITLAPRLLRTVPAIESSFCKAACRRLGKRSCS